MPDAVFPFPGGKSRLSSWILEHVPDHTCFVEVFGGAAGVLVNKDPAISDVEIYNDRDADLVHFFEVLRDQTDELLEWLDGVPYSRDLYRSWADAYYNGYRPSDDIVRAGQFFFLRYAQWGGTYGSKGGFATSKVRSQAQSYSNKRKRLREFADRFDDVLLENLDWRALIEKHDGEETVFYLDPPYVGKEDYYRVGEIDHEELVDVLGDVDGCWLCSYAELPDGMGEFNVSGRDEKFFINNGTSGSTNDTREHLVTNFSPDTA